MGGASDGGAAFAVDDPATGETIASVPDLGAAETARAIAAAEAAFPAWRARTAKERAAILRNWQGDRARVRPAVAPTIPLHCRDEFAVARWRPAQQQFEPRDDLLPTEHPP